MVNLIDILASGVTDSTGNPLSAGTVTFYDPGTTTPKTIYQERALSTAHANPATLDQAGRLVAYSLGRVKLVIKDSGGATIHTFDHVGSGTGDVSSTDIAPGVVGTTSFPAGLILPFGGSSVPAGYLLCDGSAVSRSTYSDLFNAVASVWGAGDGTTTFNVPDLRGHTLIGAGTHAGLSARSLGAKVGEENHALTIAELAAHDHGGGVHNHPITDPGHYHSNYSQQTGSTSGKLSTGDSVNIGTYLTGSATTGITVNNSAATVTSQGSGTAHNTMQPSAVVTYIIKT